MPIRAPIGDISAQFALDTNALGNLKLQAKSDPKQALQAVAGQFEALFMQMLLKSMREAIPQDGPLTSDTSKTYTAMFDQQIALQLSKKGIGIADMLVKQMSRVLTTKEISPEASKVPATVEKAQGVSASRVAAAKISPTLPDTQGTSPTNPASGSIATTVQGFIDALRPYAEAAAQKMGVPAHYLIAQAGLETGWGKSQPRAADGTPSRNLFGVKATEAWKGATINSGTTEYSAGQMQKTTGVFRAYGSYTDTFQDFAALLQNSRRYANALANSHNAGMYAASLQKAGYATDPRYAEKLTQAIHTVARYAQAALPPPKVVGVPADKRLDLT